VQIRTREMHRDAEGRGRALALQGKGKARNRQRRIPSTRKSLGCGRCLVARRDRRRLGLDRAVQARCARDTVYVLTPQGRVIDLPQGATPVGFRVRAGTPTSATAARRQVNGAIGPARLLVEMRSVEIITAKTGGPSRDWLNPALGTVKKLSRAQQGAPVVQQSQNRERCRGRPRRGGARAAARRKARREPRGSGKAPGFDEPDELFAAVGREEVGSRQLQTAVRGGTERTPSPEIPPHRGPGRTIEQWDSRRRRRAPAHPACALLQGPRRPTGFRDSSPRGGACRCTGATARASLASSNAFPSASSAPMGQARRSGVPVDIVVRGNDRQGLLRDVTETLVREKTNVIAAKTQTRNDIASMYFTVEVERHRPVAARPVRDRGRARCSRCRAALTRPGPEIAPLSLPQPGRRERESPAQGGVQGFAAKKRWSEAFAEGYLDGTATRRTVRKLQTIPWVTWTSIARDFWPATP